MPEYSGAAQKRFAWGLALAIALPMFVMVVLNDMRGPITMIACVPCLLLMFFEVAFGICLGCKMYNLFNKEKATLCPGGACQLKIKQDIQKVNTAQIVVLSTALLLFASVPFLIQSEQVANAATDSTGSSTNQIACDFPAHVKWLGHEDMYRKHANCK